MAEYVVVLPVEIGMPMFINFPWLDYVIECRVTMITQKSDKSWKFRTTDKNGDSRDYTFDAIGRSVFLTREDAEKETLGKKYDLYL